MLFLAPLLSLHTQTHTTPQAAADARDAQLEQFLQDDVARMLELQEQAAADADAATAASSLQERQQRRLSSGSLANSNSSISFVRLPDDHAGMQDEEEDADDHRHSPVAAALAAATAIAAVDSLVSSPTSPSALLRSSASGAMAAAAAAQQQQAEAAGQLLEVEQQQEDAASAGPSSSAAAATGFAMEADEDIAVQKAAARARLAQLQQEAALAALHAAAAEADAKGVCSPEGSWDSYNAGAAAASGRQPGSMHSSIVPERPRGLAGRMHSPQHGRHHGSISWRSTFRHLAERVFGLEASDVLQQHEPAVQAMRAVLLLCVALLPLLWVLAPGSSSGAGLLRSWLPPAFAARAGQLCHGAYVAGMCGVLLYCLVSSLALQAPILAFVAPDLERRFMLWHNGGKVLTDCLFQVVTLLAGVCMWQRLQQDDILRHGGGTAAAGVRLALTTGASLLGSALPVVALGMMRSARYVEWRETLLAGSRLASIAALSLMQLALPAGSAGAGVAQLQLSTPLIVLAQLLSITCMQVRLGKFVPFQVGQALLLLLLRAQGPNPLLCAVQLLGGGLCLPCLLLHRLELQSRKAFLATLSPRAATVFAPRTKAV
jgi:hypothetical protein